MSRMRRAIILKMAAAAYEMDLDVLSGVLHQDDGGHWLIGEEELMSWLAGHQGEEIVLVLGSLEDERDVPIRTCRTCGRDYTDLECPYCRENRRRLRGERGY